MKCIWATRLRPRFWKKHKWIEFEKVGGRNCCVKGQSNFSKPLLYFAKFKDLVWGLFCWVKFQWFIVIGWIEVRRCSWIALSRFLLFNLSHFLRLCCPKNFRLYLLDFILFYFSLSFSSTFSFFSLLYMVNSFYVIFYTPSSLQLLNLNLLYVYIWKKSH